ncbi:MAG TPA: hypothetical protein DEF79_04765 [Gammaproteobacteria bacterium]|nr:hypothetical protein [Gammaproteobacteria bacterium]|tara:strand:- start:718 stop:966 length:249 start_codon:yes stop_codon:yes gene_type:complete
MQGNNTNILIRFLSFPLLPKSPFEAHGLISIAKNKAMEEYIPFLKFATVGLIKQSIRRGRKILRTLSNRRSSISFAFTCYLL